MKDLLKQIAVMENEMDLASEKAEYWLEDVHFDMEKSDRYEAEADEIYERLYQLFDKAADMIVGITSGQINKVMAMTMIRSRREDVERIFA